MQVHWPVEAAQTVQSIQAVNCFPNCLELFSQVVENCFHSVSRIVLLALANRFYSVVASSDVVVVQAQVLF